MPLTLSGLFSKLNVESQPLDRAIAQIALLKGINTAERRQMAQRELSNQKTGDSINIKKVGKV